MSHEEAYAPRSLISGEGFCIATTRGFNRAVGYYPCSHVINHITEVVDDETGATHTNVEQLYCPMRLQVCDEVDIHMTAVAKRQGYDVELHEARVVGPEDDRRPGGCNHSEVSYLDLIPRTNTRPQQI